MAFWNPWRGCRRVSEGCRYCFIHEGDKKRAIDTSKIEKSAQFDAPIKKTKNGYKMKDGQKVYVCFSSDFLIEEADAWRGECWQMIKERPDLQFIFLTKRIERFLSVVPEDWGDGYENVTIGVSVENQARADQRLALLQELPIKHKNIICQPLIEEVTIQKYLDDIELVMAGGEYHREARPLAYEWVLKLREEAVMRGIPFEFRQCGTHFIKDGRSYQLNYRQLFSQAKKAGINWYPEEKIPTNR
ncbi:DUF5131 family protein [Enterococcus gilvus]|uniref:DUF5131 family protein n=1 Tax=Enterococcus gilvus TaxID=160453 RepID=UPI002910C04C|nr:DUF5131 family protein [Enterococcus gilvus]MDU5511996.1 DUF5131 family protein [Enterococcus gilvus]